MGVDILIFLDFTVNRGQQNKYVVLYIPSVLDRDNPCFELSHVLKYRLSKIEVPQRIVTPPSVIVRESIIRRTEVCCGDYYGSRETPIVVVYAFELKASTTTQPIVEQSCAQCSCVCAVALVVEISIPASSSYIVENSSSSTIFLESFRACEIMTKLCGRDTCRIVRLLS